MRNIAFLTFVLLISQSFWAQSQESSWVVGVSFNAINDSDDGFSGLFNLKENLNIVPFPSQLNVGRMFANGMAVEGIGSYNKYKSGKMVEGRLLDSDKDYYAIDSRVTYALNRIWGGSNWLDPYIGIGLGYTNANSQGRSTYNGIVGLRAWFSDQFGLDFSSSGKWSMTNKATNHIQFSVGGVYRFDIGR